MAVWRSIPAWKGKAVAEKYEDIINCTRPISTRHLPMSHYDRAAQFSPFAALTGYDGVIAETARLTDREVALDVGAEAELDEKLRQISESIHRRPEVTVTYFRPDSRKTGGAYVTVNGKVKKIDEYTQSLCFADGTAIPLGQIFRIE